MITNIEYGILEQLDNNRFTIWVDNKKGNREEFLIYGSLEGLPNKVSIFDILVNEGFLGQLEFEDFITDLGLVMDIEELKSMYIQCVSTNNKLENLFGKNYVKDWHSGLEEVI